MELIKCPVCGENYSSSYRRCPFCEENGTGSGKRPRVKRRIVDRKKTQSARGALIVVLIAVLALLSWYLFGDELFPRAEQPAEPTEIIEPVINEDPVFEQPIEPVEPPVEIDVSNARLNRDDFTLSRAGEQFTIRLSGTDAAPVWVVDNPNVITITADGTVTAMANGSTTVHCQVGDRDLTCIVRVNGTGKTAQSAAGPLIVGGVALAEPTASAETPIGTGRPLEENVDVSGAKLSTNDFTLSGKGTKHTIRLSGTEAKPTWSVDDPSVATVDENGIVTAAGDGKTTVHCKVGDRDLTCIVRVNGAN